MKNFANLILTTSVAITNLWFQSALACSPNIGCPWVLVESFPLNGGILISHADEFTQFDLQDEDGNAIEFEYAKGEDEKWRVFPNQVGSPGDIVTLSIQAGSEQHYNCRPAEQSIEILEAIPLPISVSNLKIRLSAKRQGERDLGTCGRVRARDFFMVTIQNPNPLLEYIIFDDQSGERVFTNSQLIFLEATSYELTWSRIDETSKVESTCYRLYAVHPNGTLSDDFRYQCFGTELELPEDAPVDHFIPEASGCKSGSPGHLLILCLLAFSYLVPFGTKRYEVPVG